MRRILSVLLENESGALSRMTIETYGDEQVLEQIEKQLHKLVDVFKVINLSDSEHVEREVMLIKVRAQGTAREELKRLTDIFRAQIVDVTTKSYIIQLTGTKDKLDAFVNTLKEEAVVIEIVRSGLVSLPRGEKGYL